MMKQLWLMALVLNLCFSARAQQTPVPDSFRLKLTTESDHTRRFQLYTGIIRQFYEKNDLKAVPPYLDTLFQIAQQQKNDSLWMESYRAMAGYLDLRSDSKQQIEYLLKALPIAENGYPSAVPKIYTGLGSAYSDLRNFDQALKYLRKAKELTNGEEKNMLDWIDNIHAEMMIAFLEMGKADSALHYAQRCNEYLIKHRSYEKEKALSAWMGTIYEQLGNNTLAHSYYRQSMDTNALSQNRIDAMAAGSYSQFLLRNGQLQQAKFVGLKGLEASLKSQSKKYLLANVEVLQKVYSATKQPDSAYYYASLELDYRDSLFNQENINAVNAISLNEDIRQKEEAIKRSEEALQRKHDLQYEAIALGLVVILIGFFLLSNTIIVNQRVIRFLGVLSLLILFEFINLLLHPFIGDLTHHSPFLMLLFLVCIAALLIPLHHRLEHWITHILVEKNKKLRLAAAKKTIAELEEVNAPSPSTDAQQ